MLDLMCWWLEGTPEVLESQNDSLGGPESVSFTKFRIGPCLCEVKLSWLTKLANKLEIFGSKGHVVLSSFESTRLQVTMQGKPLETLSLTKSSQGYAHYANEVVDNFLEVIDGTARPVVPGAAVLDSLELIDQCYALAKPFQMPWDFRYITA